MTGAVTQANARADAAIMIWFFRDISDEQRTALIYLVFGDKVAAEATNHGLQRLCLRKALDQIRHQSTAPLIAALEQAREALQKAREALHFHYVEWDGEPEDAVPLQLARSDCDAALASIADAGVV
jgi:hypothetical protein